MSTPVKSAVLPKAILFDHDGVLVSSEELHFRAWQQLIRDLGLPWDEIDLQGLVGRASPQILKILFDRFRPGWDPAQYDLDALALKKNDIYLEYAKTHLAPYPGVRDGLEWLKSEGIPCAVVSNAKRRELNYSMEALQLGQYFGAIISRDDALRPKPDPAPFELGALSLGVAPADCLAIDDSPTGLEAAFLAGCRVASVTTNYPAEHLWQPIPGRPKFRCERVERSMDAIFGWLQSLPRGQ